MPLITWSAPDLMIVDDILIENEKNKRPTSPSNAKSKSSLSSLVSDHVAASASASETENTEIEIGPLLHDVPKWRNWQETKSPNSNTTLEAVGRAIAHIARKVQFFKEEEGFDIATALANALMFLERLASVPQDVNFELHNTTAEEMCDVLKNSSPSLVENLNAIDPSLVDQLLVAHVIDNIAGRLTLNSIRIPSSNPKNGLFVILSHMNHNCEPNVEVRHNDENSEAVTLVASKKILPGEELCISYVPVAWDLKKRKQWLQHWCFECACAKCCLEKEMENIMNLSSSSSSSSAASSASAVVVNEEEEEKQEEEPSTTKENNNDNDKENNNAPSEEEEPKKNNSDDDVEDVITTTSEEEEKNEKKRINNEQINNEDEKESTKKQRLD